ncbi:MAG: hypothetical protein KAH23_06140 [Kiritimatiellae bacterium]|nr:hypothetical protein [Kiritimatiellia bacterium]
MTFRSVIIGLIGALIMGAFGQYVNKYVPGVKGLVRGHLPVSVFGLLVFSVIVINPILGKIHKALRLRAKELAVIVAMILLACGLTDAGLMRHFPRTLVFPLQQNRTHPGWQKAKVLEETPSCLLANGGKYSEEVVENYVTAMGNQDLPKSMTELRVSIKQVPWGAWRQPLIIWGGIIVCIFVGVISLSVVVHRQWAEKERIRYPIAELATSLLRQDEKGYPAIFRNRIFWLGVAIPLALRVINGLYLWFPQSIEIPLSLDFSALGAKFPLLMKTSGANYMTNLMIYPACLGLTYMLASDIGFSLSISNIVSVLVLFTMFNLGVDTKGSGMTGGIIQWQNFGSFLAMAVMLIYIGRRYYWLTLKEAVSFRRQEETEISGVWACRVFIVCMAGATAIITAIGLDWHMSIIAVSLVMLLFFVCARLNAECGTFFFAPAWNIPAVLVGLFGLSVMGPKAVIILGLIMYILTIDPFECLMPYVVNGLKTTSDMSIKVGRVGIVLVIALLITLAVTIPTALWADYYRPAEMRRGWDTCNVYDAAATTTTQLTLSGELEKVKNYSSWDRLKRMRPNKTFLFSMGIGFFLLIACSAMRLRYTWWPFHPVLILVFGAGLLAKFCFSFFLGWLIKITVSKFGGAKKYIELKPMMIGVIVGDLSGGFLIMFVSWIYYAVTKTAGQSQLLW